MHRFIVCLLVGLIAPAATAQSELTNQRLFDTTPFMEEFHEVMLARFESQPVVKGRIMFLGDSITQGGRWDRLLGDSTVVNRGIGGDITFGLLARLDDVIRREPSKLFLLIGINDIGKDIPEAVIADNVRQIIERVQRESPSTQIYLQSVLPVNPAYPGFPQHYDKEQRVVRLNKLLRDVAIRTDCRYINLFAVFMDAQERLDASLTADGLHLNEQGYAVWVDHLRTLGYL